VRRGASKYESPAATISRGADNRRKHLSAFAGRGQGGPCLTDAAQEAAPDAAVREYAATPRPEHCRGDHRGLRTPGALHLPRLVVRITMSDSAHDGNLGE